MINKNDDDDDDEDKDEDEDEGDWAHGEAVKLDTSKKLSIGTKRLDDYYFYGKVKNRLSSNYAELFNCLLLPYLRLSYCFHFSTLSRGCELHGAGS